MKKLSEYMDVLDDMETYERCKSANQQQVFVFSADWCPDCLYLQGFMESVVKKHPEIHFIYVNRDEWLDICEAENILGIPSFLAYRNGIENGRFVSTKRKSLQEVESFLGGLV